jgi:hypothetical protein
MTASQSTKPKITVQEENPYMREHEVYGLLEGSGILRNLKVLRLYIWTLIV